jgi:hypothetical protein
LLQFPAQSNQNDVLYFQVISGQNRKDEIVCGGIPANDSSPLPFRHHRVLGVFLGERHRSTGTSVDVCRLWHFVLKYLRKFSGNVYLLIFYQTFFQCRLIVSQMSDTRADAWNFLMSPVILVALLTTTPIYTIFRLRPISAATESMILYILTALVTFAQLHYGQGVVREMCHHFKIKCFKVSRKIDAKVITANNSSFSSNGKHVANNFYSNNLVNLKSLQTKNRD